MDEGLCTRSWKTQRQLHLQKPTPAWVTALESWKPEVHHTACRQLDMGESLSSSFLSWSEPPLGSSASLKVLVGLTAYKKLGRKEDIVSVKNFLKFLLFTFLSFKKFQCNIECLISLQNILSLKSFLPRLSALSQGVAMHHVCSIDLEEPKGKGGP